jgi:hypothetical protein
MERNFFRPTILTFISKSIGIQWSGYRDIKRNLLREINVIIPLQLRSPYGTETFGTQHTFPYNRSDNFPFETHVNRW